MLPVLFDGCMVKIIDKHFGFTDSTNVSMPRDSNEQWPMFATQITDSIVNKCTALKTCD